MKFPPRQVQTPQHQLSATRDVKQGVRPATGDFWEGAVGVWNACDVQLARDDDLAVENAITGDGDIAAGGDGALGFAFDSLVGVGFIDAGVVWGVAVVGALGGCRGTRFRSFVSRV